MAFLRWGQVVLECCFYDSHQIEGLLSAGWNRSRTFLCWCSWWSSEAWSRRTCGYENRHPCSLGCHVEHFMVGKAAFISVWYRPRTHRIQASWCTQGTLMRFSNVSDRLFLRPPYQRRYLQICVALAYLTCLLKSNHKLLIHSSWEQASTHR